MDTPQNKQPRLDIVKDIQKRSYDNAVMEVKDCLNRINSKQTKSVELHLVLRYERENVEKKTAGGGFVTYESNFMKHTTISYILNRHLEQIKKELETIASSND
jgi:hypothetical protein